MQDSFYLQDVKSRLDRISSYVNEDGVKSLLHAYMVESDALEKARIRDDIEAILSPFTSQLHFSERPSLPAPRPEQVSGQIELGHVVQGDRRVSAFRLQPNDLCKHVLIAGQSGAGKSTILFHLIDQFIEHHIPFLYFDVKRDGRTLLRRHPDLTVIPWKMFRWNPLRNPPGVDLRDWWTLFTEVCGHAWSFWTAGTNYLHELLTELYPVYERTGRVPTMAQLYQLLVSRQEATTRRRDYFDVIWNRVRTVSSIAAKMLDVSVGVPIEELLSRNVVIELEGLRATDQDWIVSVILSFIYSYRMAQNHRGEVLLHGIICDEAQRIWDSNKGGRETSVELGMPVLDMFPQALRDLGEALILTTQVPSRLSHSVNANTFAKIAGNLGSGRDVFELAEVMGLDDPKMIGKLKRGEWIVKLSDRFTEPFLMTTESFPVDRDVSDQEVVARLRTRLPQLFQEEVKVSVPVQTGHESFTSREIPLPRVSEDAKALILDVNSHPFRGCYRRYKSLGLSGRKATIAKSELVERGLVKEVHIRLGNYRPVTFLLPTDMGVDFLQACGAAISFWKYVGHVSFEHRLVTVLASYPLRDAGFEVRTEAEIGNLRLDMLATSRDGRRVGVEVVQSNAVEEQKLLECLRLLDEIFVVCKDERTRNSVQLLVDRVVPQDSRNRVMIETTGEFLRRWKNRSIGMETSGSKVQ